MSAAGSSTADAQQNSALFNIIFILRCFSLVFFSFLKNYFYFFYTPAITSLLIPPQFLISFLIPSVPKRIFHPPTPARPPRLKALGGCSIHELVLSFFSEREPLCAAQTGLKLSILLPSTCRVWDHRSTPTTPRYFNVCSQDSQFSILLSPNQPTSHNAQRERSLLMPLPHPTLF